MAWLPAHVPAGVVTDPGRNGFSWPDIPPLSRDVRSAIIDVEPGPWDQAGVPGRPARRCSQFDLEARHRRERNPVCQGGGTRHPPSLALPRPLSLGGDVGSLETIPPGAASGPDGIDVNRFGASPVSRI
jgi:hypothetical protein